MNPHTPTRRAVALTPRTTLAGRDLVVPRLPPAGAHPVRLCGIGRERARGAIEPTIVERRDDDFVGGLLAQLARTGGIEQLADDAARLAVERRRANVVKLFPPIQRVFNLVLVEAFCAQPGLPRLDPRRIESAGLVLRRRSPDAAWQSWEIRDRTPLGWRTLPQAQALLPAGTIDDDDDPVASRRAKRATVGNDWIDRRLRAQRLDAGDERVVPLHPLPDDLCARLGRTVLFGLLPLGSDEVVDRASTSGPTLPPFDAQDRANLADHLVHYLRAGGLKRLPRTGEAFDASWGTLDDADDASAARFARLVLQLRNEFDAFGAEATSAPLRDALGALGTLRLSAEARAAIGADEETAVRVLLQLEPAFPQMNDRALLESALRAQFDLQGLDGAQRVRTFVDGVARADAFSFLQSAAQLLALEGGSLTMPGWWLPVDDAQEQRIVAACAAAARARLDREFTLAPAGGQYSSPDDVIAARCFIRVAAHDPACPPDLTWSAYSEPLRVAPWWESAGVKPRVVPMPDLNPATLKALKPNIGFALPAALANLVQARNLDAVKDGDKPDAAGGELDFVCGFNIPIITICAFLVLNIFLKLLNIVFAWMPFVKICIPLPKIKAPGP